MTPNLLVIWNIGDEDDVCRLFLPYWRLSGCDLLFSSPLNSPSKLNGVDHVNFGKKLTGRKEDWHFYQERCLDTFKYVLTLPYQGIWFNQYDSFFLGRLPELNETDCIAHCMGNKQPPYKASIFTHPPWGYGRKTLQRLVDACAKYDLSTLEDGAMDRAFALVMEENGIKVSPSNDWSFSCNSLDSNDWIAQGRQAVKDGKIAFHGIKTAQMLNALLE